MFSRRDRRELSVLGLLVLAWGLLAAPLAHAFTHGHGHGHSHGTQPALPDQPEGHGAGSVEHLLALATTAPAVPQLVKVSTRLGLAQVARPVSPSLESWDFVAKPQGP